jgi:hydroxymethylglutaryl-CoA lyase
MSDISIIECPRDAMQGWTAPIPTEVKVRYINALLRVGFSVIDFGSFVSPRAIPQMADTAEVLAGLDLAGSRSSLLAIVANLKGAEQAAAQEPIRYLGYPFSLSETFQRRNTNSGMKESLETVRQINNLSKSGGKELVVYLSMGFGNPYGDPYDSDLVLEWTDKIVSEGIGIISVADTVGLATPSMVRDTMNAVNSRFSGIVTGVHLHATPDGRADKLQAAWDAGCRRFDSAMAGIGGCPMAGNDLVGNMDTQFMVNFFENKGKSTGLDLQQLSYCASLAKEVFAGH